MNVELSFFDRLIRKRSDITHKDNAECGNTLRLLQKNLMTDLSWLLNTRQLDWKRRSEIPRGLDEVNKSLFLYGLPDFSEKTDPKEIENLITQTIRQFEPRLKFAVQHIPDNNSSSSFSMSFRITAHIDLTPAPVAFIYEPVIEVENGQCRIRKES